jgi:SUMO ligase MMS21 Smc5/6 complex component
MDVLCPIGRNIMVEPMKSKKCPHVFEMGNIESFLGKVQKNCPVAGCIAKLSIGDMTKDYDTEIAIKEYLKNGQSKINTNPSIALSDEEDDAIDL